MLSMPYGLAPEAKKATATLSVLAERRDDELLAFQVLPHG